jgi:hypothetical protein
VVINYYCKMYVVNISYKMLALLTINAVFISKKIEWVFSSIFQQEIFINMLSLIRIILLYIPFCLVCIMIFVFCKTLFTNFYTKHKFTLNFKRKGFLIKILYFIKTMRKLRKRILVFFFIFVPIKIVLKIIISGILFIGLNIYSTLLVSLTVGILSLPYTFYIVNIIIKYIDKKELS